MTTPSSILVAGVGNIFLGDDGFGSEVARLLAEKGMPEGVRVVDFGIRGFDLACALVDPNVRSAVIIDAAERGGVPGSLYVIEPTEADDAAPSTPRPTSVEPHALDPVAVFALARHLGTLPACVRVVACEPALIDEDDMSLGLSPAVEAAVPAALRLVESLVRELLLLAASSESHA